MVSCSAAEDTVDTDGVPAWMFLDAAEPEEFHAVLNSSIEGAVEPSDMVFLARRSLLFVRDEAAGRVHVLDERYRHSQEVDCLPASLYGEGEYRAERHRGVCSPDHVEQHRGYLTADSPVMAMDGDSERLELHFLTSEGFLYKLNADLMEQSGLEFLRVPETSVDLGRPFSGKTILRVAGNWAWIASERSLIAVNRLSGELQEEYALPGDVLDFEFWGGAALVSTTAGLWQTDGLIQGSEPATDLYRNRANEIYAVMPDSESVERLDDGARVEIPGLDGPVLSRSATPNMWALAGDELVSFDPEEGELERFSVAGVVSMQTIGKGEMALLHEDGSVTVVFDDASLIDGSPLSLVTLGFAERPKSMSEDEPCTEGESTVQMHVELAATNLDFLRDLPGPVALGVTPHLARRARQCGFEERFANVLKSDELEVGVLVHQQVEPDCAVDADCYANFLLENATVVASYGAGVHWVSGMASHYESGADWVDGLIRAGFSNRFLFFGLSVLSQVAHESDSRSKEVFPMEGTDKAKPWKVSSAEVVEYSFEEGEVALFPGDARAGFNLGSCPNLLVRECLMLNRGGGEAFKSEDIEVLNLLLRRRLAERDLDGGAAWSFHLPDIGVWNYVEGCSRNDRVWEGECDAQILQDWLFDVHQLFALNGAVKWAHPSELPWP